MRHARTRRRFKLTLIILLVACLVIFVEGRIEAFVPQVGSFAELKLEEALGGRVKFSIGSLEGGIVHPLEINDISIKDNSAGPVFPMLVITSVKTDYRVWDVLFQGKTDGFFFSKALAGGSHVDINFVTRNREFSGFVRITNKVDTIDFTGYLSMPRRIGKINFSGHVRGNDFDISIRPRAGSVKAIGSFSDDGMLMLKLDVEHLKALGFDWKCAATMRHKLVSSEKDPAKVRLEGDLQTDILEMNYRQFLPLKAVYSVSEGVLSIIKLQMGESFGVSGKVLLKKPYDSNITLLANNVSLNWLFNTLGLRDSKSMLSGVMNGKFEIKGAPDSIKSDSRFDVRNGTISTLDFDRLTVHLVGTGPVLRIEDSRITRSSGHFVLAGEMDLSKMGKASLFDQVRIVGDEEAINWDGMKIQTIQNTKELSMTKRLSDDISLDFNKFVSKDNIDESSRRKDNMTFDYKLNSTESLKMMVGSEDNFLGIEHKDKF